VTPATDPTDEVAAQLAALRAQVEGSVCCPLGATRTRLVFGEGDPHADLMFVGEAPGYHEDQQGRPFVGQAGKLLEQLLASIGLTRERVYIANVLKCRPPNNRDPLPAEVAACEPYLWRQIELIQPRVICSLGNHATKLLSGRPYGITRVHGKPQLVRLGERQVYLYPIFHPAAALYTPKMLTTLKEDFARLPEVLELPLPSAEEEALGSLSAQGDDGGGADRQPPLRPPQEESEALTLAVQPDAPEAPAPPPVARQSPAPLSAAPEAPAPRPAGPLPVAPAREESVAPPAGSDAGTDTDQAGARVGEQLGLF